MFAHLVLAMATLLAATAHAQTDQTKLTDHGRIMLDGAVGGRWSSHPSYSGLHDGAQWEGHVRPGITYFVANRVGIGVSVGGGMGRRDVFVDGSPARARDYDLLAGPDAVLELPLLDRLSLVALPGIYYVRQWRRLPGDATRQDPDLHRDYVRGAAYDTQYVRFSLSLPIALRISSSIAIGFGPTLWYDVFVSQDPRTGPPTHVEVGPFSEIPASGSAGPPYPRTRWVLGATSWIGVSF